MVTKETLRYTTANIGVLAHTDIHVHWHEKKNELNGFLQQLLLKTFQRRMMTVMNDNHPHIPMHFVLSHFRCVTVIHIYMLRRNSVKEEAYTSLTRSSLEYACYIWDPYNKG